MLEKVLDGIFELGVTPVGLRPPYVTPSNTLTNYFIKLFTDISIELLQIYFLFYFISNIFFV